METILIGEKLEYRITDTLNCELFHVLYICILQGLSTEMTTSVCLSFIKLNENSENKVYFWFTLMDLVPPGLGLPTVDMNLSASGLSGLKWGALLF